MKPFSAKDWRISLAGEGQRSIVSRADEYRDRAVDCMSLASVASTEAERLMLVNMANGWLKLAEQAEKNAQADLWYETPPLSRTGQ